MKTLFCGCSYTSFSGFQSENIQNLWVNIVSKKLDFTTTNIAMGGMSNDEIFKRTLYSILTDKPDLVVVMWSEIHRMWFYTNHLLENVDEPFLVVSDAMNSSDQWEGRKDLKKFAYTYKRLLTNNYKNFQHWLINIVGLQTALEHKNIPYIFLRGFPNDLQDWINIDIENLFTSSSELVKESLDFNNKSDDYLKERLNTISNLTREIDTTKWVNFYTPSFREIQVDTADDGWHPGKQTNMLMANEFLNYFDNRGLGNAF